MLAVAAALPRRRCCAAISTAISFRQRTRLFASTATARLNEAEAGNDDPSSSTETTSSNLNPSPPPLQYLPIAAFIDLDNVAPKTHKRDDIKSFLRPLRELWRKINNRELIKGDGKREHAALQISAFGNLSTRTWKSAQEKGRPKLEEQVYTPWHPRGNSGDGGFMDEDGTSRGGQSGYDADGNLRCGVCGARMKLTRKEKAAGRTLDRKTMERKLKSHMKLHGKEQQKRRNRLNMLKSVKKRRKLGPIEVGQVRGGDGWSARIEVGWDGQTGETEVQGAQ